MKKQHPNTLGRELALMYLYMRDILRGNSESFDEFISNMAVQPDTDSIRFAKLLIENVSKHSDELDAEIQAANPNWTVARMAIVDRNVLRIGVAEFQMKTANYKVVIDEAVELGRKYGQPIQSPPFINGVLDGVRKGGRYGEKTNSGVAGGS